MQTQRRRKAPSYNLSLPQLAVAYKARKRRTLEERSFDPSDRAAIEAALGRPIDEMEEGTLRGATERADRVAIERGRVWPIEIDSDIWGAPISMERAAHREAIHRHGALVIDGNGQCHGMSPRAAFQVFASDRDPRPTNVVRPPTVGARARQSHGASHGGSAQRGGDSGDDGSGPGSSGDGDGDPESSPTLVEAFRACTGRDPKAGRLCACGCGASIDHLAKQARWLPSHQQRYNEERDRVGFGPIIGQPYEAKNRLWAEQGDGDGGNLGTLYKAPPLEHKVGEHFDADYWRRFRDGEAEPPSVVRRRALAARSLVETRHQLDAWRRRKGFEEAVPLVDTAPPTRAAAPGFCLAPLGKTTTGGTVVEMATWGRARSWSGFVTEAVAA